MILWKCHNTGFSNCWSSYANSSSSEVALTSYFLIHIIWMKFLIFKFFFPWEYVCGIYCVRLFCFILGYCSGQGSICAPWLWMAFEIPLVVNILMINSFSGETPLVVNSFSHLSGGFLRCYLLQWCIRCMSQHTISCRAEGVKASESWSHGVGLSQLSSRFLIWQCSSGCSLLDNA